MSSGTADGVDAGVEVAVRISQGYCIYAGCFPINVIPPPMSFLFDVALTGAASRVPAIGSSGRLGRGAGGAGLVSQKKIFGVIPTPMTKFNTATAWTMGDGLGAPYAVGEACAKWFEAADQLGQARAELMELMGSLSSDQWSGDDREAFNTEVGQLAEQIGNAQLFAQIVAWSLVAGTAPLAVWPLGCSIMGVIQFTNASLFYAAVASVVGNLGPSEALYASGMATSVTCNRILSTSRLVMAGMFAAAAAAIAGGAIATALQQEANGDEDAVADLERAVVDMAVTQAVSGLAASGLDALTPWPLDAADAVAHPENHIGQNQDPYGDIVDEHLGEQIDDLAEGVAETVVGDDHPDTGPFSS